MSSDRSIKEAFNDALGLPADQRAELLDRLCSDDAGLRERVEKLLAVNAAGDQFLASPTLEPGSGARDEAAGAEADRIASDAPDGDRVGRMRHAMKSDALPDTPRQIGPYKLLERIGEGGFGVIFMAEQEQPVRRRVALKIIKPGMDTR
jgi:hypothetical protein